MSEHLPRLLADFLAANPTIDLDLEDRESPAIAAAVAAGDADIGIASQAALAAGLESHPFRPDRLVLIVPAGHRLARRRQVGFAELLDLDFVGLPRGTALDGHLAMQAARLGRMLRLRVRVSSLDAVCAMVAAGVGAGIVPEATARRQRRGLPLALVRIAEPWANRELMLCVRDSTRGCRGRRRSCSMRCAHDSVIAGRSRPMGAYSRTARSMSMIMSGTGRLRSARAGRCGSGRDDYRFFTGFTSAAMG